MKTNQSRTSINKDLVKFSKLGQLDVVKYLIEKGADNTNSALTAAAYGGHLDTVRYLIKRGADNIYDAMLSATYGGHLKIFEYLKLEVKERSKT